MAVYHSFAWFIQIHNIGETITISHTFQFTKQTKFNDNFYCLTFFPPPFEETKFSCNFKTINTNFPEL